MTEIFSGPGESGSGPQQEGMCPTCGKYCLVWVRMRTAPTGVMDLFERQMMVLSEGHWTWKTMTGLAAMMLIFLVPVIAVLGVLAAIGYFLSPVIAAGLGAIGAAGGIAKASSMFRRSRQPPDRGHPPTNEPDDPPAV